MRTDGSLARLQLRFEAHDAGMLNEGNHHRRGENGRHVFETFPRWVNARNGVLSPDRDVLGVLEASDECGMWCVHKGNPNDSWRDVQSVHSAFKRQRKRQAFAVNFSKCVLWINK